jgi:hypothetical protein
MTRSRPTPSFLERLREREAHAEKTLEKQVENADKLLEAVNDATKTVGGLLITFVLLCSYALVIIASTTDEMLLRESPVILPILRVKVDLLLFYRLVPWVIIVFHFNMLVQFYLLSRKLRTFNAEVENLSEEHGDKLRERLANFHYAHLIAGNIQVGVAKWALTAIFLFTLVLLPLATLLWAQRRFVPYHSTNITFWHQLAVTTDILLLVSFWWRITSQSGSRRFLPLLKIWLGRVALSITFLIGLALSWFVLIVPGDHKPWEEPPWTWFLASWIDPEELVEPDPLIDEPVSLSQDDTLIKQALEQWWRYSNLDLRGKLLTENNLSAQVLDQLCERDIKEQIGIGGMPATILDRVGDVEKHRKTLQQIIGLDLRGRDLRYANLADAKLLNANLSRTEKVL